MGFLFIWVIYGLYLVGYKPLPDYMGFLHILFTIHPKKISHEIHQHLRRESYEVTAIFYSDSSQDGTPKIVKLPKKSGWSLWFLVDVTIVNGCERSL